MTTFDLGIQFDVVTCLFGAFGYAGTEARLGETVARLARHVVPGGVLVVEPWMLPDSFEAGHTALNCVNDPDLKVARVAVSAREGDVAILHFQYLIGTREGIVHQTEEHRLTLFTMRAYEAAMRDAGVAPYFFYDANFHRGLYAGVKASGEG